MTDHDALELEPASDRPPLGLAELLRQLGAGESGFGGTAFGEGACTLEQFLRRCMDDEDPAELLPGYVPQTTYWMIAGPERRAAGMVRVRHCLNEHLLQHGGHIGFYVHRGYRRRGYATRALGLALERLRALGVQRALLTAMPSNTGSIRAIIANGGVMDGQGVDRDTGIVVNRYWIELFRGR